MLVNSFSHRDNNSDVEAQVDALGLGINPRGIRQRFLPVLLHIFVDQFEFVVQYSAGTLSSFMLNIAPAMLGLT